MSGSTQAAWVIPIVVAPILFAWIAMVFYANRRPRPRRGGGAPNREVTGGIFRGQGPQVMPRRDAPPEEAAGVGQGAHDGKA